MPPPSEDASDLLVREGARALPAGQQAPEPPCDVAEPGCDDGGGEGLAKVISEYPSFGMICLTMTMHGSSPLERLFKILPAAILVAQVVMTALLAANAYGSHSTGWCPRTASASPKVVISAISVLYFVRVTSNFIFCTSCLNPLDQREGIKRAGCNSWLLMLMSIDELFSLTFDSAVYLTNMFIVFESDSVKDMVLNALAAEFLTAIDDEFKDRCLKYVCAFKLSKSVVRSGWTKRDSSGQWASRVHFMMRCIARPITLLAIIASMVLVVYGPLCKP